MTWFYLDQTTEDFEEAQLANITRYNIISYISVF